MSKATIIPERRRWLGLRKRKYRLGRHIHFDERSRAYRVVFKEEQQTLVTKIWDRPLPPLDQGNVGSCSGNGCVGVLATAPNNTDGVGDSVEFCEALAIQIYTRASQIDDFPGAYPEQDTGSSVLAVMKAAKELGLIAGYRWCIGIDDVLRTLSHIGSVEVGVQWYSNFDRPDNTGLVSVGGELEGGHAFELVGIDVERQVVWAVNSWGPNWGIGGRFCISFDDLRKLLTDAGEAVMVLPPGAAV